MIGMAVGVFSLIVVLSVMNGFDHELKQRILRVVPHGFVTAPEPLKQWETLAANIQSAEHLIASAPFIEGNALLSFGNAIRPIQIQGVDPAHEKAISVVDDYMLIGELDDLSRRRYGIVLGRLIAGSLGLNIGDTLTITLPQVSMTPAGVFPRTKRFTLTGVFEVGAQVDQSLGIIHLRDAQRLLRYGDAVQGLHLKFDDIYRAPAGVDKISAGLGKGYQGKDWSETQGSLFQAVKMEKTVVGVMLGIIIAVAAFNIITSLTMMVMEKRSNIAVLRTLGMSRPAITAIFLVQGVSMGVVGVILGAVLGSLMALNISEILAFMERHSGWRLFDPVVYFVSFLPSKWQLEDALKVCGFAIVASFMAAAYPSWKASKIDPAEALKYDT